MTLSTTPLGRSVSHRFIVTPEYVERRTANVSREQLTQDLYSTLGDLYGTANIFGSLEVLDFPEYISPGGSLQIRFMQIRGVGGFTELADENILLYPPEEESIESIPQPPILEGAININTPFIEGNLWRPSPDISTVTTVFPTTTGPVTVDSDATRTISRREENEPPIQGISVGLKTSVNDEFLEELAKRLSISTEVSRDRGNLVVKTSLFLERDDISLITVDSFEGHIDIDELKD